jgi:hypothetical protein
MDQKLFIEEGNKHERKKKKLQNNFKVVATNERRFRGD